MNTTLTKPDFHTWSGRLVRHIRRRRNDQCINIVTYHSVSSRASFLTDGTSLRHDPATFERQIDYLAEHYNPIRLSSLISALDQETMPERAVVVTFDDGYADTLRRVLPILYRRRFPMTVFPVTSVVGNRDLLWQHKLAWLLANGNESRVREALKDAGYPPQDETESLTAFTRRCYRADLPEILEEVLRTAGTRGERLAASLRPYLEPEEIAEADPDLVEFGNHTHTHPVLSALNEEEQQQELVTARDALTRWTGLAPIALAYPFGLKRHYDENTKRLAKKTGHRAALDMRRRINVGAVDPFELSRKPAPCGSLEAFEKQIEDWPVNATPHISGDA